MLFVLLSMLLPAAATFGQIQTLLNQTRKDFRLEGTIVDTRLEDYGASIHLELTIELKLTNVGKNKLLLWKHDKPRSLGYALSREAVFEREDLIDAKYLGISFDFSDKWRRLREDLDKKEPPATAIRTLLPNETWSFVSGATVLVQKEAGRKSITLKHLSMKELESFSTLWIKVFLSVWNRGIELNPTDWSNVTFSKALQERWSKDGVLIIDNIASDPIRLDVRSALAARGRE